MAVSKDMTKHWIVASLVFASLGLGQPSARIEKQHVATITAADLKGGVVAEITWDGNLLLLQGVFAEPSGQLSANYLLIPADGVSLKHLPKPTDAAIKYWDRKSSRVSPTGLGKISASRDAQMPLYGVGSQERRMNDAHQAGGIQTRHVLRLESLTLLERSGDTPPYDGETYSWSPAELNRIAYVDGKGDLWVAMADGRHPQRLLTGNFTLPAWSEDGTAIAVAERKDGGRRWDVSLITLPQDLRSVPR